MKMGGENKMEKEDFENWFEGWSGDEESVREEIKKMIGEIERSWE